MSKLLDEAAKLTAEDRQRIYGHPIKDFGRVAAMSSPIMESTLDPRLKHPLYMITVKIARLLNTPDHYDTMVDIAGYINTYHMVAEELKKEHDSSTIDTVA